MFGVNAYVVWKAWSDKSATSMYLVPLVLIDVLVSFCGCYLSSCMWLPFILLTTTDAGSTTDLSYCHIKGTCMVSWYKTDLSLPHQRYLCLVSWYKTATATSKYLCWYHGTKQLYCHIKGILVWYHGTIIASPLQCMQLESRMKILQSCWYNASHILYHSESPTRC